MRNITLDTNAYSAFLRGDPSVYSAMLQADLVHLPVFVLGELYYGFKGGKKEKLNKANLGQFLEKGSVELINTSRETATIFADIKYRLKRRGKPIPLNDVWIAALAIEAGSVLITYDHHFKMVEGLRIWEEI